MRPNPLFHTEISTSVFRTILTRYHMPTVQHVSETGLSYTSSSDVHPLVAQLYAAFLRQTHASMGSPNEQSKAGIGMKACQKAQLQHSELFRFCPPFCTKSETNGGVCFA